MAMGKKGGMKRGGKKKPMKAITKSNTRKKEWQRIAEQSCVKMIVGLLSMEVECLSTSQQG